LLKLRLKLYNKEQEFLQQVNELSKTIVKEYGVPDSQKKVAKLNGKKKERKKEMN